MYRVAALVEPEPPAPEPRPRVPHRHHPLYDRAPGVSMEEAARALASAPLMGDMFERAQHLCDAIVVLGLALDRERGKPEAS